MTVNRGYRNRVAYSEVIKLVKIRRNLAYTVALINAKHHGLAAFLQHCGNLRIRRGNARLYIGNEYYSRRGINSELRLRAAETALQELGLIDRPVRPQPQEPAQEPVAYTTEEVRRALEEDGEFRMLTDQTQNLLGKRLNTTDLKSLMNLYSAVGLPADVIFLLVSHCVSRTERRYGPGRRPTIHQIEKEGYYWAQQGLFDQESAAAYLREYKARQSKLAAYMQVLRLGDRRPIPAEEKYITGWMNMGFPPETVAIAYEKTILKKQELNWRYLNGILRRWHEENRHTPEQAADEGRSRGKQPAPTQQQNTAVEKYLKW